MYNVALYSPPSVPEAHFLHPRITSPHFSVWKGEIKQRYQRREGWKDALSQYRSKVTSNDGMPDELRNKLQTLSSKLADMKRGHSSRN